MQSVLTRGPLPENPGNRDSFSLGSVSPESQVTFIVSGGAGNVLSLEITTRNAGQLSLDQESARDLAEDRRWEELFADPRTASVLAQLATEALAEDDACQTRDLDELLAEEPDSMRLAHIMTPTRS